MGYILKNTSGLINTRLTDAGRQKLSQGNFNISYFQIGDSEVSYNVIENFNPTNYFVFEPSFNAQNIAGSPQSNKENVKYPIYVDDIGGNTYGIPFMDSIIDSVYNTAAERGFFSGTPIEDTNYYNWSALTNNLYTINSNYVVQMNTLNGTNTIDLVFNSCNPSVVRNFSVGDIITIYYDGSGLVDCNCSNLPTPTPTPTNTTTPTPTPSACLSCTEYQLTSLSKSGCVFEYTLCDFTNTIVEEFVEFGTPELICSSTTPIVISGSGTSNTISDCSPFPCPSQTPTPTPTATLDPCGSPTPTPTPSATFCPTPTPSRACPPPPPPNCVVSFNSCFPVLTYRIVGVCLNTITLDRPTPDFSYLSNECYGRTIIYPPKMTEIYDSITPFRHWNDNVINFESVCYTDQFDVKIWNMNIPWSESPAGLDSSVSNDYTKFGSVNYLGTKEYLGYASSSGQTDTSSTFYFNSFDEFVDVLPEDQKAIGIIHYTNQTIDLFYGEKFAMQPFDDTTNDTTGQARNFKIHLPWIMWHKNPNCCFGQTFWVDPPGFEDLELFQVNYIKSTKNVDMNDPGIRYFHLWDDNPNTNALTPNIPNRVGKVFPDLKIIVIDDEELLAAMSYKSNRNWTLPAPKVSLITPNICGLDNNSVEGILTGNTEYLYVTYRLSNEFGFTNSLHCNYYQLIQGPNITCNPITSQNVSVRFGNEFGCLSEPSVVTTTTTCPCWYNGFMVWLQFDSLSEGVIGFYFENSNQLSNGYPIFSSLFLDQIANFYFDGSQWILSVGTLENNIYLNFENTAPLGNFSYIEAEGLFTLTGFTQCDSVYYPILLTICSEDTIECNDGVLVPLLSGSTQVNYLGLELGAFSTVIYDGNNWVLEIDNSPVGELTGLTVNDPPIGTWDILEPTITAMTSNYFWDLSAIGCGCLSIGNDCVVDCIGTTLINYADCYGVIRSEQITSYPFTACSISYSGQVDYNPISGDTTIQLECVAVCTTTTTQPICGEIVTSTTTLCPDYCNITSGFYADKFQIICQKVSGNQRPEPTEWKIIDFTDQLSATSINGYITQSGLTGNTFVITQDLYDNADAYVLTDYIHLPTGTTTNLNFGDEYYFYGNIETDIQATIYEMRYKINLGQSEFLASSNPTWDNTKKVHISEIGLYDSDKTLMIVSKLQSPYPRTGIQQFVVKFDF